IRDEDLAYGLGESVENATQSIKNQYHAATTSAHKSALFEQVLLACALANKDQLAFFRASDVVAPLSAIMGKSYDVPAFARHLFEFSSDSRGTVLHKQGPPRRIRYRFSNPLLEPYVIMHGRTKDLVSSAVLASLSGTSA